MPECKHYKICRRDAEQNTEEGMCILHSQDPEKNKGDFDKALAVHRQKNEHNFKCFVFPGPADYFKGFAFIGRADFSGAQFTGEANFEEAEFRHSADFRHSSFQGPASFFKAVFADDADFAHAKFTNGAYFSGSRFTTGAKFFDTTFTADAKFSDLEFTGWADFGEARFSGWTYFANAAFNKGASFSGAEFRTSAVFFNAKFMADAAFVGATFTGGADFSGTTFNKEAQFYSARFLGTMLFVPWKQGVKQPSTIFSGTEVNFSDVIIAPLDALIFRDADLRKCQFLGTDLRKAEFTNVKWPEKICKKWPEFIRTRWPQMVSRFAVYDEIEVEQKGEAENRSHVEQLYRQLKQNYEDRRDYERARHFHIGEKEMRRKNSRGWLWILLTVYRWVSGYGESCLLPLLSAAILLAATTAAYLRWGLLLPNKDASVIPNSTSILDVALYGLRVMTLLKPSDFVPSGSGANFVNWIQSIFGPLLFALFALALRQRLKR